MKNLNLNSLFKFWVYIALLLFALLQKPANAADQLAPESKKPNVLFILADDMRPDHTGYSGNTLSRTPNLDTIGKNGFDFTHAYCMGGNSAAVCRPSRTMLLTGLHLFNLPEGGWKKPGPNPKKPGPNPVYTALPKVFEQAGYDTCYVGKPGNTCLDAVKAFQYTDLSINHDEIEASQKSVELVLNYMKQRKPGKPFFIHLAPPVPHDPRVSPPEMRALFTPENSRLPISYLPMHPFNNGHMDARDEMTAPWPRTESEIKRQVGDYMGAIANLDFQIGRIFELLKQQGEWENTVIIFAADNGLSLGDHGLMGKQNLYEFGGMHVPLTICGPGIPHGRTGALVYLFDLYPTLCELAKAKIPETAQGKSLLPIIHGTAPKTRDYLMTAYRDSQRSFRDEHWHLIRYPFVNRTQLFDMDNDPHELHDLASQPEQAPRIAEMMKKLQAEMTALEDPVPLTVENPISDVWTPEMIKAPKTSNNKKKPKEE